METTHTTQQKKKNLIKKNRAEDLDRHFSQEDTYTDNRYMEKVLGITNQQEMQFTPQVKYHSMPVRTAIIKSQEITRLGEAIDKCKLLCTVSRNVNWYNHNGK